MNKITAKVTQVDNLKMMIYNIWSIRIDQIFQMEILILINKVSRSLASAHE